MRTSSSSPTPRSAAQWPLIFVFVVVSLALTAGGYGYCRQGEQAIRAAKYAEIKAIAELKIDQIVQWRQERVADARINATGSVRTYLLQWLTSPADAALQAVLLERMQLYADVEGYQNIILTGADGRLLLSLDPSLTALDATAQQLAGQAVASGQVVFGDFFRSPDSNQIYLDVAAPILDENRRSVAVLIQRINPEQYLYSLIQTWPTPSQSAETLLLRQDGADALYLNTLRHVSDPPLTLRIPLTRTGFAAAQAALGRTGEFQGRDYRGVEVLAEIQPVPGTPWFMIAKVDTRELLAEARFRGQVILLLVALAIVMTGVLAALVYTYRQRRLTQALLRAEQARRQAQEETRATLYSIGDGVIATDVAGCVTRMNPVAEALTGWREAAALGQPLAAVFRIVNEETRAEVENPVQRVLCEGVVVGLANHTLLIARDGIKRPIADSGAPIRDEQGRIAGVVLVFRDQTEERAAQKERALFADTISASLNEIYIFDAETLRFRFVNAGALHNLGYALEQLQNMTPLDIKPEFTLESFHRLIQPLFERQKPVLVFETVHRRANGSIYPVEVHLQLFDHEGDRVFLAMIQDITARKQAEEALRESEQRFRGFIENASDIVYGLTPEGIFTYLSPTWLDLMGEPAAEAVGKSFELYVHPDDVHLRREFLERVLNTGERLTSADYRALHRDGSIRWHSSKGSALRDRDGNVVGYMGIARDVTERKRAEEALLRQAEHLRNLHETDQAILLAVESPEVIAQAALHYLRGRLHCQRASVGIFDLEKKEVRIFAAEVSGKTIVQTGRDLTEEAYGDLEILRQGRMEIVEDMSRVTSPPAVARVLRVEGIRSSINVPLFSTRGLYGALNVGWEDPRTITPEETEIAGKVAGQITIAMEQVRLLQETKRYAAELEQRVRDRTAQLQAVNQELESFAYSVSHDLRAPLRAMEGFSAILLSRYTDKLDEQGQHYLDRIQQASQRMGQLINDLLNLSRVTRADFTRQPVDLAALAREVAAELRQRDPQRQVEFVIAEQLETEGDPRLLRIVLQNLLENAWKFTGPRPLARIEVGVLPSPLSGQERGGGEVPVYFVRDNGVGFDMAYAAKLFAPFQRLHSTQEFPGTGIGLVTVQRIITRHGGRIWAEAAVDAGATFYFTLGGQ